MKLAIEYMLCYSTAFALGMAVGAVIVYFSINSKLEEL